jgi:hypothetical protein
VTLFGPWTSPNAELTFLLSIRFFPAVRLAAEAAAAEAAAANEAAAEAAAAAANTDADDFGDDW